MPEHKQSDTQILLEKFVIYPLFIFLFIPIILNISCSHSGDKMPVKSVSHKNMVDSFVVKRNSNAYLVRFQKGAWESFLLGDLNHDNIDDTAFVYTPAYYESRTLNDADHEFMFDSCVNNQSYNKVRFSCDLPEIFIENSIWGKVEGIDDLDSDGYREIIFQTNWFIGTHVDIYVYSFNKKKWVVLAENNLYEEDSYRHRVKTISKEKFKFKIEYMDTIEHDLMNKYITVKIRK